MAKFCGTEQIRFEKLCMLLVKLEWRRGGVVKNGQKLKKGSFSPIKTLTREMSPIGMKQETRKKI